METGFTLNLNYLRHFYSLPPLGSKHTDREFSKHATTMEGVYSLGYSKDTFLFDDSGCPLCFEDTEAIFPQ